ncbi:popeye domain-containing protein 3-like isoform X1 [Temnothorax curvispinosus]|uniref:Popeye domain-containing protein 3-like isoform X1 n=1 Tax=Temnothorax curvispinosus TaxID=300111 RepID=A0A6J1QR06_9HYME|nr:popeye domain-containing protein 3-like isoform X1 [Temnothorax curvispinosus]
MSPGLGHDPLLSYNYTNIGNLALCVWQQPQHILFQLANFCFALSYAPPAESEKVILFMHSMLIIGFMLLSGWAWHVICAPDIFSWNFSFLLLNIGQLVYIVYQMRPIRFDPELEEVYHTLFYPFQVSRIQFKRLVSPEFATIMSLHAGEAYAMQNLTRTDRLGLLLSGKVNVINEIKFLHPVLPCEFLDSPEFESSRSSVDDKFKVSIIAASTCRYLFWQRSALEYLLVKETYLATVLTTLVARDIATKLYAMNSKMVTDKGSHLDIRLPSISAGLGISTGLGGEYRSLRARQSLTRRTEIKPTSNNVSGARAKERAVNNLTKKGAPSMEPLPELPSCDDLASSGVESWLDSSSKYHSCEIVDEE